MCLAPVPVQERLAQQREEASSNPEYSTTFKDQLTKDEKKARRKAILANIGARAQSLAAEPSLVRRCVC